MTTTKPSGNAFEDDAELQAIYENLAGFRFAMRRFLTNSETLAGAAGVTSQQYQAMLAIEAHGESHISMKELAQQMLLLPHGAVQLIDRLELLGMARRQQAREDRRRVEIALTGKGRRTLRTLAEQHLNELLQHEPLLAESLKRLRGMRRPRPGD